MAQDKIKLRKKSTDSWTEIRQPESGMGYSFETTYTADTTRDQKGRLHSTAMFTVESFSYEAKNLTKLEMSTILNFVAKGKTFYMHYFSPYYGVWRTDKFYVGQGSLSIGRLRESDEKFDSLSFNIIGVTPI